MNEKIKIIGLSVSVYHSSVIGNCSNSGISTKRSEFIIETPCGIEWEVEPEGVLKVVRRTICGSKYVHAEPKFPTEQQKKQSGPMSGGTFVYTCDSRFREYINEYPVSLHDRWE